MSDTQERRADLADFLRARRELLRPRDVGLPEGGGRRRTPGLRREEVAVLAGLSPTWYAYLEQGRRINPSPSVIESLSRVLRLTAQERRYLFALVQHDERPERPDRASGGAGDHAGAWALIGALDGWDYPVYILDSNAYLLAWNRAAAEWFTDFSRLPVERRNFVRWMFCDPEARDRFMNWEDVARHIIGILRSHNVWPEARADRARLVHELRRDSPEFDHWWGLHEVRGHTRHKRVLLHPRLGVSELWVGVVHPVDDTSMTIAFHVPSDERA